MGRPRLPAPATIHELPLCGQARQLRTCMGLLAPIRRPRADQAARSGLLRSVRLFRLFLAEQADPETFYAQPGRRRRGAGGRAWRAERPDGRGRRRRGRLVHRRVPGPRRALLPVRTRSGRAAPADRRAGRRGGRGRLLAAGPRRRRRRGVLLERARACLRSDGPDRGDDPGHPAGRAGVPVVLQLVLAVGRARDVALALPGVRVRRAPVRPAPSARAQAPVRRQPVPRAHRAGAARACGPGRTSSSSKRGPGTIRAGAACWSGCPACARSPPGTSC